MKYEVCSPSFLQYQHGEFQSGDDFLAKCGSELVGRIVVSQGTESKDPETFKLRLPPVNKLPGAGPRLVVQSRANVKALNKHLFVSRFRGWQIAF